MTSPTVLLFFSATHPSSAPAGLALEVTPLDRDALASAARRAWYWPEASDAIAKVALDGKCQVLRLEVGEGASAPIYLNCPFAAPKGPVAANLAR